MKVNSPIAVTGANGLAGSAVVEHLRKKFSCVMPITRFDADLRDGEATLQLFRDIRPEYVYHAAATVYGIGGNMRNQAKSLLDNTLINTNVINACQRVGVKKIVAMGTNAIYPDPPILPYFEEDIFNGRPHSSESGYGHAKRHMLAMLEAYNESYGLDYAYIVSGNLYGPRDTFDPINGHVLPSLIWKFHEAKKDDGDVILWGDGSAQRDFLFSKDLARIVEMILSGPIRGAINTGSGHVYTIKEVATALCFITGVQIDRVKFDHSKPNGRLDCTSDLTRLKHHGFVPNYSLYRGLVDTWDWYCEQQESAARPSVSAH